MKSILILCVVFFTFHISFAQSAKEDQKELYPSKYSFEKAAEYEKTGDSEKAIWFYINLFHEDKLKVVECVKTLSLKPGNTDMSRLIKKTFADYGSFDPAVSSGTFSSGEPKIDMVKLKEKRKWADELIASLDEAKK